MNIPLNCDPTAEAWFAEFPFQLQQWPNNRNNTNNANNHLQKVSRCCKVLDIVDMQWHENLFILLVWHHEGRWKQAACMGCFLHEPHEPYSAILRHTSVLTLMPGGLSGRSSPLPNLIFSLPGQSWWNRWWHELDGTLFGTWTRGIRHHQHAQGQERMWIDPRCEMAAVFWQRLAMNTMKLKGCHVISHEWSWAGYRGYCTMGSS